MANDGSNVVTTYPIRTGKPWIGSIVVGSTLLVTAPSPSDPGSGPSRAIRAEILDRRGHTEEAADDVLAAARLSPGDAAIHQLAARLAFAAGRSGDAWEQAIRAAQAGAATDESFDPIGKLARVAPMPQDFLTRIEAPRMALVVGPSLEDDPFARAALGKAMRAVGNALGAAPLLGLTRRRADADFVLRVSDKSVPDSPPRRFRGRITVTSDAGESIYDEDFTLDDLDDPERCAADLAEHLRDIAETRALRLSRRPANTRAPARSSPAAPPCAAPRARRRCR
jgi:hypothetical protein